MFVVYEATKRATRDDMFPSDNGNRQVGAPEAKACEILGLLEHPHRTPDALLWCRILFGLARLNCLFQILWLWRHTRHSINIDANLKSASFSTESTSGSTYCTEPNYLFMTPCS